jgi:hypothetical protein
MTAPAPPLDLSRSGPWLLAFLGLALVAFWPTYLSLGPAASSAYTHLHAVTATAWMLLLIAQPIALRRRRFALHRTLGRLSFVLAPLFVAAVLLLAHDRIRGLDGPAFAIQSYVLYLQLSLAALFALAYALAVAWRRRTAWHARFMICTALTLVDPVVIRLMFWIQPIPAWNYQWFTFGLTDALLVLLIWLERHQPVGRGVFPAMLAVFVALQLPAVLGLTASAPWQAFARWVAALG